MTNHIIRFNGHITWAGRADGLPKVIYAFLITENANEPFITKLIEDQTRAFVASQVMYAQRDQGQILDLRLTPKDRMLVPFHQISCIDVDVIPMTGELSMPDEKGIERLENGEEPVKQ